MLVITQLTAGLCFPALICFCNLPFESFSDTTNCQPLDDVERGHEFDAWLKSIIWRCFLNIGLWLFLSSVASMLTLQCMIG